MTELQGWLLLGYFLGHSLLMLAVHDALLAISRALRRRERHSAFSEEEFQAAALRLSAEFPGDAEVSS